MADEAAAATAATRTDGPAVIAGLATVMAWGSVAIFLGWAALGQTPPWLATAGGALCLAGVYLARRRATTAGPRRPRSQPANGCSTVNPGG
jgi:drug/metabolite transporter (DMT)-like permease